MASIWRYKYVVAVAVLVGGLLGYFLSSSQAPQYGATARLFLTDPSDPGLLAFNTRSIDMDPYVLQQLERVTSQPVLAAAAEQLGGGATAASVDGSVSAEADLEIDAIILTATASDPQRAAGTANAVVEAYAEVANAATQEEAQLAIAEIQRQAQDLQDQLAQAEQVVTADPDDLVSASRVEILTQQIIALDTKASDIAARAAILASGVEITEEASVPGEPYAPSPTRDAALGGILFAAAAAAFAYWRAGKVNVVETGAEPARILGVPLLGEVPRYRTSGKGTLADRLSLGHAAAEAYQFVLSSMQFALAEVGGQTVLVTSAAPGDGKTVSALQLAVASVRDGRRTTLVDADIRAHGLTATLQAQDLPGLSDMVRGHTEYNSVLKRYRVDDDVVLPVVTAGTQNSDPAALLRSPGFSRAAAQLRDESELVLFDTPPLLSVVDATIVAAQVDGIVIVVSHNTSLSSLSKLNERLAFVSTPLLGYIYNRATEESGSSPYGYGYAPSPRSGSRLGRLSEAPLLERLGAGQRAVKVGRDGAR
jgi:capsular exopolysaccharide synthesis family protein